MTDIKAWRASGAADLPLADRAMEWDSGGAEGRVRQWAGGPDRDKIDWDKYGRAFFAVDGERKEEFTGYKLGFADVVDGKLVAVPRGVFAVAAVLMGSRGGVDLPAEVQDAVKARVAGYYHRIEDGLKAPWEEKSVREGRVLSGHDHAMFTDIVSDLKRAASAIQDYLDANAPPPKDQAKALDAARSLQTVRALEQTADVLRVGGYGVVWGGRDLYATYFTRSTDFWDGKLGVPITLYDHGFNPEVGRAVIGKVTRQQDDDIGRWIEAELDAHNQYVAALPALLAQAALGWSSGSIQHLVDIAPSGEIKSWPIVEFSLTPVPAEPRTLGVQELRSLAECAPEIEAVLSQTDMPEARSAGVQATAAVEDAHEVTVTENTNLTEVTNVENEELNKIVEAVVEKYAAKMAAAFPAEKTGQSVTLENAPKDGSGHKSLGNWLYCVQTRNEKRLRDVYGSTRDLLEDSGASGGYLVPPEFIPALQAVAAEDSVVRAQKPLVLTMKGRELDFPVLNQQATPSSGSTKFFGGVVGTWTEEGQSKTETEPAFKMGKLVAHELSGYTQASNALMADSAVALEQLLVRLFGGAKAWFEDMAFLRGNGVGQPLGILNSPALIGVTRGTDAHFTMADVGSMLSRLVPSSWKKAVWLMHPTVIPDLLDLRNTGNYPMWNLAISGPLAMTLAGLPIVFTEKVGTLASDYSVVLADFSYYVIGDKNDFSVDASEHYAFINNITTWRFTERVDGQPWLPGPIYLQNASTTVSAFVALEDHT